jgi:dihydrofolate reductase
MKVSLIVAVGENREIGKDNDLLWHLPKDMRFFTQSTKGHHVIMGRKNWDSIPLKYRPLSNRENVVVSRKKGLKIEGAHVVESIEEGIELARKNGESEAFIIGGGQIYRNALENDLIDTMYLTKVHASFDADTFFPKVEMNQWEEISNDHFEADEKNNFSFSISTYLRKR